MGSLPGVRASTDKNAKGGDYFGPDGLFEIKGFPKKVKSTKRSHSKELQDVLWNESVKLTGLNYK